MRELPPDWSPAPWELDGGSRRGDDTADYVLWTVVLVCGVILGVVLARLAG